MRNLSRILVLLFAVLMLNNLADAADIVGSWKGLLHIDRNTALPVKFEITKDADGAYSAAVSRYVQGDSQKFQTDSVVFNSKKLSMNAPQIKASFEATVKRGTFDKTDVIRGDWKQEGKSYPLNLWPYNEIRLSPEDMTRLQGSWSGAIIGAVTLPMVFRFEMTPQGEFLGYMDQPDQNSYGVPISDIQVKENELLLKSTAMDMEFKGPINNNIVKGKFIWSGSSYPLTLAKGGYAAIDLPKEIMDLLIGEWTGAYPVAANNAPFGFMNDPGETISTKSIRVLTIRFARNEKREFTGLLIADPARPQYNRSVTSASMNNKNIILRFVPIGEFHVKLKGDKMDGEWKQSLSQQSFPLSLEKK